MRGVEVRGSLLRGSLGTWDGRGFECYPRLFVFEGGEESAGRGEGEVTRWAREGRGGEGRER